MNLILIDNYDSFTYNLVQYLEIAGAHVSVYLNDQVSVTEIQNLKPDGIIISPGPGNPTNPQDIGICSEIINTFQSQIPILGICLGHQLIGHIHGESIQKTNPIHGQKSVIETSTSPLFKDLPHTFEVMRYHSLIIQSITNRDLKITSQTKDGIIMSIEHKNYPTYGVQFHPESIGTIHGQTIINNFIRICQDCN